MAERDPIELIKEQLNAIDALSAMDADQEAFQLWQAETKMILEKAFGTKSIHYQGFVALKFREVTIKAFSSPEIDRINLGRYRRDLENAKNILLGALKELTADRTLFRKIQTTPTTVEVSRKGDYFISSGITDPETTGAIQTAFEGSGLRPIHGLEAMPKREPLHGRLEQIKRAKLVVCPTVGPEGAEVLLEIGMALGLGKEILLLHKKGTPLIDCLKPLRPIEYEDLSDLTSQLRGRIG